MLRVVFLSVCVLLFASLVGSAPAAPAVPAKPAGKGPLADARRNYEQQLVWSKSQFDQAVKVAKDKQEGADRAARTEYVAALKKALAVALKAQNLEEANAVDAEIKALERSNGEPVASKSLDDQALIDIVMRTRWVLDQPGAAGRQRTPWTFEANGTVSDAAQPFWWLGHGELITYKSGSRWLFNQAKGRWENEANPPNAPDRGTYLVPAEKLYAR